MKKSEIEKLLNELNVPFAIVANVVTGEVDRYGDPSSIQPAGLIKVLFGDTEAVSTLSNWLEGQTMPRSFGQGDVAAVLCKPKPDLIVGLFCSIKLSPVEYYHWTKRLCDAVDSAWN